MGTEAKLYYDGTFRVNDEFSENLPIITDGLVAHYPFDGSGIDVISGNDTTQNVGSGANRIESITLDWRNPSNWSGTGVVWDDAEQAIKFPSANDRVFIVYIPIDTSKNWYIEGTFKETVDGLGTLYFGTVSYDVNKSTLPGHPGTRDYFGAVGVNLTTDWVTYKNSAISGNPRTGESTTQSDYTVWHTGTKYARICIYSNYSAQPGYTYLKDLKLYTTNVDTSNTTFEENGVSVQKAVTNLVSTPTIFSSGWSSYSNGNDGAFMTEFGVEGLNIKHRRSWCGALKSVTLPAAGEYTLSVWVKLIYRTNNSINVTLYSSGGGISDTNVNADWNKIGEWQKLSMTRTYTTTGITLYLICFGGANAAGYEVSAQYTKPQVEANSFASAFVNGTSSLGILSIPNPVTTGDYTINFKCRIPTNVGYVQAYQGLMSMGGYYTTNSWSIMDSGGTTVTGIQRLIRKGALDEWAWSGGNFTESSNFNEWNTLTLVRNSTNYRVYQNGVYKGTVAHLSTTMQGVINIGARSGGGDTTVSSIIKDLSIYNRALSDAEVATNSNSEFSVQPNVTLIENLKEESVLPLDAIYYPLSSDTSDQHKTYLPSESTNLAFEDGSVWVGQSVTNLTVWPDNFSGNSVVIDDNTIEFTGQQYRVDGIAGASISSPYMLSWRLKGTVPNQTIRVSSEGGSAGVGYDLKTLTRQYKTYTKAITSSATGTFSTLLYQFTNENSNYSILNVESAMVQYGLFASPYCVGIRGAGALEFNFNSSLGLDWNGDWSISYWKKPIATYNNTFTAYNIESLGCNSNSVGGGYVWFGKDNAVNNISSSTPGSFTSSDYFNHWHMVTLVKSGTTVTIRTRGINGIENSVRTYTLGTVATNYYVTQYGYDFKLGGWDNANPTNTFFRDLVVAKRAFTDLEQDNMYKQLSVHQKDGTYVKNIIEQGI